MAFEPGTSIAQIMAANTGKFPSAIGGLSRGYQQGLANRQNRDLMGMKKTEMDMKTSEIEREQAKRTREADIAAKLRPSMAAALGVSEEELPAGITLDEFGDYSDILTKTDDRNREQIAGKMDEIAGAINAFETSVPEGNRGQAWQGFHQTMLQSYPQVGQDLPSEYDPVSVGIFKSKASFGRDLAKKAATKPLATIENKFSPAAMSGLQETKEREEYGKVLVGGYTAVRDDARAAETALQQYQMAKNIDLETSGPIEAWKASAGALAANLGFDPDSFGIAQANNVKAYQGIMQNMVLTKMQAQKGPQTENDSKRIEMTLGTIANPEGARKFLLDAGIAMETEKIDKHDFWMKWRDTHNGTFDGAESAWSKFRAKTPFLASNPKTGRPVFFSQFVREMKNANQGISYGEIVDFWQKKYGE